MAEPFVGEVRLFAGNYAPAGWVFCQGQTLTINENEVLFTLIGTTYGGDGVTTFCVPNLTGQLPIGQGQGPQTSNRVIGQKPGAENVTLTLAQLPAHKHVLQASSDPATSAGADNGFALATGPAAFYNSGLANLPTKQSLAPQALSSTGGSQPIPNLMPTLSINYIIATTGYYPMQG
ncbi:microcystin dependent MdpB family protein [Jeongeupia sp. HS-3]|uniref:phage tail protein n=1 Tax=Jeongeupia sp. HS-3 TaxID=1009682 RepID=UPI0018A532C0|nr:tail fiber protein [Jeongeupia sp. HS-3]BCL76184.1 microcystin dependent MdpB family protein [Jeongeupia sp. HS-3]